jgi:hypothetical protein
MKRFLTILLAGLLITAITAPAIAWEFSMTGETEFRYRYFARQGQNDLFGGPAGISPTGLPTGTIGLAGPMSFGGSTGGVLVQGFSAKGADASICDQRVWLYPEIRVNPAIRLRGEYWLTGTNLRGNYFVPGNESTPNNWVQPFGYNGWYVISDGTPGNGPTPDGMSIGLWEKWWATIQLPWGIFVMGRRPAPFGPGWDTSGERDIDSESFALVCPYGPLTLGGGIYPRENGADVFNENNINTLGSTVFAAGGTDKNRVRSPKFFVFFTYRNGPVEMGSLPLLIFKNQAHTFLAGIVPAGPAARDDMSLDAFPGVFLGSGRHTTDPTVPIYGDPNYVLWPSYVKYNNGRFFFNAMYAFEYADARRNGGRPISTWADAWELEFGAMCGPAKLSLAGFYHSGDDRRGGLLDVTGATGQGNTGLSGAHAGVYSYDKQTKFLVFGGAEQPIQPYEFLLGIYGSGNNSYDPRGKCRFLDFLAYAARLDYAVAANLNVFGSFIYAMRASNTGTPVASFNGGADSVRSVFTTLPGGAVPNVPDNYLGWEGDVGVNWKLLEGLTFNSLFAYWQPGDWFKYAYIDFGNLNTVTIGGLSGVPIDPNRGIDPIIGWQGSFVVDF